MFIRPRRLRLNQKIRDLVSESEMHAKKLIMPYFIIEGENRREKISSMPGIERVTIDNLLKDLKQDTSLGIKTVLLFGIPNHKDDIGSNAFNENGIIQKSVKAIKDAFGTGLTIITDVCLCEYTSHGHCGIVEDNYVVNDSTTELLAKVALSHAVAGADIVAPSDMMDGRVEEIRFSLDENGFSNTLILSYAAKYCSSFYGPFRQAAGSAPQFGDRKTYQMDIRNTKEALKEITIDIEEGADIVMIKPALSYLDVISRAKEISTVPLCAYNVSGEYAMVKCMAEAGYADETQMTLEILTSIFRAGADFIISYHTKDVLKALHL